MVCVGGSEAQWRVRMLPEGLGRAPGPPLSSLRPGTKQ